MAGSARNNDGSGSNRGVAVASSKMAGMRLGGLPFRVHPRSALLLAAALLAVFLTLSGVLGSSAHLADGVKEAATYGAAHARSKSVRVLTQQREQPDVEDAEEEDASEPAEEETSGGSEAVEVGAEVDTEAEVAEEEHEEETSPPQTPRPKPARSPQPTTNAKATTTSPNQNSNQKATPSSSSSSSKKAEAPPPTLPESARVYHDAATGELWVDAWGGTSVESVAVFADRADVTRAVSIPTTTNRPGGVTTAVIVHNLTAMMVPDSVRVAGPYTSPLFSSDQATLPHNSTHKKILR